MSRLVKARNWIREKFEPRSRPTLPDVVRLIEAGEVPGVILGGVPYVYADQFDAGAAKKEKTTAYSLLA